MSVVNKKRADASGAYLGPSLLGPTFDLKFPEKFSELVSWYRVFSFNLAVVNVKCIVCHRGYPR